jgi:hypothetical protein
VNTRTDFAVLGTQQVAQRMGVTLPEDYRPAKVVNGRARTCRYVEIGIAHHASRNPHDFTTSEEALQSALLEPRTSKPLPLLQRIAGAVWRRC